MYIMETTKSNHQIHSSKKIMEPGCIFPKSGFYKHIPDPEVGGVILYNTTFFPYRMPSIKWSTSTPEAMVYRAMSEFISIQHTCQLFSAFAVFCSFFAIRKLQGDLQAIVGP